MVTVNIKEQKNVGDIFQVGNVVVSSDNVVVVVTKEGGLNNFSGMVLKSTVDKFGDTINTWMKESFVQFRGTLEIAVS